MKRERHLKMNNDLKNVLQKLVDKLEFIEKDDYVRNLHKYVFSLWKTELKEAKRVLAVDTLNEKPKFDTTLLVVADPRSVKDVDLFDVKQLELDDDAKKLFKATLGVNLLDD